MWLREPVQEDEVVAAAAVVSERAEPGAIPYSRNGSNGTVSTRNAPSAR